LFSGQGMLATPILYAGDSHPFFVPLLTSTSKKSSFRLPSWTILLPHSLPPPPPPFFCFSSSPSHPCLCSHSTYPPTHPSLNLPHSLAHSNACLLSHLTHSIACSTLTSSLHSLLRSLTFYLS